MSYDYVIILDSGKIVANGTPNELKNAYASDFIRIYNKINNTALKELENKFNVKSELDHTFTFTYDKINYVHITYDDTTSERSNFGWHSTYLSEITNDDIMSTVSNKYFVYKPSVTGYRKLNIEGDVEIFCTADGLIGIHTDIY